MRICADGRSYHAVNDLLRHAGDQPSIGLTLAEGFKPPTQAYKTLEILAISIGTDPNFALKTRKGTGYYKVPSLTGVWHPGRYLHDGSFLTLEKMFDPARLREGVQPKGWNPPGVSHRSVPGPPLASSSTQRSAPNW